LEAREEVPPFERLLSVRISRIFFEKGMSWSIETSSREGTMEDYEELCKDGRKETGALCLFRFHRFAMRDGWCASYDAGD
jgi:hypothetical protein